MTHFQNNSVRQKRLPDDMIKLAERMALASRYYIKNVSSSGQLLADENKAELSKEAIVRLLDLDPEILAKQLMFDDYSVFRSIGMSLI